MHVLLVNDDGPPSNQSSPYIHSLVATLQTSHHTVSVILPHQQRSWIGKAHFASQITKPTYFRPGTLHEDDGTVHTSPLPASDGTGTEEWILVDSTPATCTQLGLFHFFQDKGPVDVVVSGPNYGRNSTSLFSLSSGTIGGAMEAAICRKKAIALSYAFYSRDHDPNLIAQASRHSVRLIEHLYRHWGQDVDLYNINVPLVQGVESNKTLYTYALQNYWRSGSCLSEVEPTENGEADPDKLEVEIRHNEEAQSHPPKQVTRHRHRHFKWTPKFTDIAKSIEDSEPGNDGWAIAQGYTSVTPLRANFMHVPGVQLGELKLPHPPLPYPHIHIALSTTPYLRPLILFALSLHLPSTSFTLLSIPPPSLLPQEPLDIHSLLPYPCTPVLQLTPYESLDFSHLLAHPETSLAHSYIIRKALIRKHMLWETVLHFAAKDPVRGKELKDHVPETVGLEVDYAEFLDEALVEAWELWESWGRNAGPVAGELEGLVDGDAGKRGKEWWIIKPGMSDKGQGIKLFCSEEGLREIFEGWEEEEEEEEDSDEDDNEEPSTIENTGNDEDPANTNEHGTGIHNEEGAVTRSADRIITSHLRHFIAQRYVARPLIFPSSANIAHRKFHIRTYVLAAGALRVYVFKEMLALFAARAYRPPSNDDEEGEGVDMSGHLTNTCLQPDEEGEGTVIPFWDLPAHPSLAPGNDPASYWKSSAFTQIATLTAHLFRAAATTQSIHFQPLPNAFEVFGVDWLVDARGKCWLLEVNAFPDFAQSGERGRGVVQRLWEGVLGVVLRGDGSRGGFFQRTERGSPGCARGKGGQDAVGGEHGEEGKKGGWERWGMVKVLDVDLGRR